jgi:hypothetical protein
MLRPRLSAILRACREGPRRARWCSKGRHSRVALTARDAASQRRRRAETRGDLSVRAATAVKWVSLTKPLKQRYRGGIVGLGRGPDESSADARSRASPPTRWRVGVGVGRFDGATCDGTTGRGGTVGPGFGSAGSTVTGARSPCSMLDVASAGPVSLSSLAAQPEMSAPNRQAVSAFMAVV